MSGKICAEPSSCVGIAAALERKIDTSKGKKICFVITGGNADQEMLARILAG